MFYRILIIFIIFSSCLFSEEIDPRVVAMGKEYFQDAFTPTEVESLKGGSVCPIFLVTVDDLHYVFRFAPEWQTTSHFYYECAVSQEMAERGVAPEFFHLSSKERGMIVKYLPLQTADTFEDLDFFLPKITETVRKVHTPQSNKFYDLFLQVREEIAGKVLPYPSVTGREISRVLQLKELLERHFPLQLCHQDLHLGNVLLSEDGEETYLIDWTFCGFGDPYIDLARFMEGLKEPDRALFYYLKREPTSKERAHFHMAQAIYLLYSALDHLQEYFEMWDGDVEQTIQQMDRDLASLGEEQQCEGAAFHYWQALIKLTSYLELIESDQLDQWVKDIVQKKK